MQRQASVWEEEESKNKENFYQINTIIITPDSIYFFSFKVLLSNLRERPPRCDSNEAECLKPAKKVAQPLCHRRYKGIDLKLETHELPDCDTDQKENHF